MTDISIVVPLFNEKENIAPLFAEIEEAMSGFDGRYEVFFVDDGSTDGSWQEIEKLHSPHLHGIRLEENRGQTAALRRGIGDARGRYTVLMDGDRQNVPGDIPKLFQKLHEGYDIVCGYRQNRRDHWLTRKLPSKVANLLIRKAFGIALRDIGCTLKIIETKALQNLDLQGNDHRYIPLLLSREAKICEMPVRHRAREFGDSKYGLSRVYKVAFEIMALKKRMKH